MKLDSRGLLCKVLVRRVFECFCCRVKGKHMFGGLLLEDMKACNLHFLKVVLQNIWMGGRWLEGGRRWSEIGWRLSFGGCSLVLKVWCCSSLAVA